MLFGTVVYNIWTKRVGDLDYESINFCSKVRYTIVTAAAHLRKGAGAAAGRTLKIEYGCERYVEMLRIINEAWKGNVDSYLTGVIRGVARFISVYEGEYSRERLVQQLARTHPKTPSRSWLRKTPEVLQTATCGRSFVSITVPAVR